TTAATTTAATTVMSTSEPTTTESSSEDTVETSATEENSAVESDEESKEPEIIWLDKSLGLYQSTTETKGVIDDYGYITIYGGVGNASKRDYSYVEIVYSIYDDAGNKTGDAIDNILGLKSGERWRYEAFGYAANGSKYKLKSITAF
ncbi:MAG: FxLYD domain-containing protein, partial [Ruminiclostridium sp.]